MAARGAAKCRTSEGDRAVTYEWAKGCALGSPRIAGYQWTGIGTGPKTQPTTMTSIEASHLIAWDCRTQASRRRKNENEPKVECVRDRRGPVLAVTNRGCEETDTYPRKTKSSNYKYYPVYGAIIDGRYK